MDAPLWQSASASKHRPPTQKKKESGKWCHLSKKALSLLQKWSDMVLFCKGTLFRFSEFGALFFVWRR